MRRNDLREFAEIESTCLETPIGTLKISACDGAVCEIELVRADEMRKLTMRKSPVLLQAKHELEEYFAGKRTAFTFLMRAEGTAFQKSVWNALSNIPFGELRTYGQIAQEVGNPKGFRAVGMACNKNPIMIAVPCHRVVGANGSLTGYAGGLSIKQSLLSLEQKNK